jgi:hypothetical protein
VISLPPVLTDKAANASLRTFDLALRSLLHAPAKERILVSGLSSVLFVTSGYGVDAEVKQAALQTPPLRHSFTAIRVLVGDLELALY